MFAEVVFGKNRINRTEYAIAMAVLYLFTYLPESILVIFGYSPTVQIINLLCLPILSFYIFTAMTYLRLQDFNVEGENLYYLYVFLGAASLLAVSFGFEPEHVNKARHLHAISPTLLCFKLALICIPGSKADNDFGARPPMNRITTKLKRWVLA